jgi:transcriptional regulator with XRE-family HTH domain
MSIAYTDKKDHATAAPEAWSSLLRLPTVSDVAPKASDEEIGFKARLGATIVKLRKLRDEMSQADLAVALNRSEPTLSRWETGKSQPSAYDLMRLAKILDAPPELLLDPPEVPVNHVAVRLAALRAAAASAPGTGQPTPEHDGVPVEKDATVPVRGQRRKPGHG